MNKTKSLILLFCLLHCLAIAQQTKKHYHRPLPYPESDLIDTLIWTDKPYRYPGTGSDMHWWTWGKDNNIYVLDDDGANFGGPINYAHVLKITGVPPNHKVSTVTDFTGYDFRKNIPSTLVQRYVDGIIAVGSKLYVSLYDYDWNLPRNLPYFDTLHNRLKNYDVTVGVTDSVLLRNMWFSSGLSKNHGIGGIIVSEDGGNTWNNVPNENTPRFLGPKFAGLTFINFGPGYTDVPAKLAPYVYACSNDGSWETGDHLYMARVHKDSILFRSAWQFLSAFKNDGGVTWSSVEDSSTAIFTDKGHVGHPTFSYNKALKRYILGVYSDTIPHTENPTDKEWSSWDRASELQLYESKNPWGPWSLFYNEMPFGGTDHTCYLPQIPNKWWSKDGTKSSIMFAGDYVHRKNEYYGLMTQPFQLILKKKKSK